MSAFAAGNVTEAQDAWSQSCWQSASTAAPDIAKSKRGISATSPLLGLPAFDGLLLKAQLHAEEAPESSVRKRGRSRGAKRSEDTLAHLDSAFEHVCLDLRHDAEAGLLPVSGLLTSHLRQLHVLREAHGLLRRVPSTSKTASSPAAAQDDIRVLEQPSAASVAKIDQHPVFQLMPDLQEISASGVHHGHKALLSSTSHLLQLKMIGGHQGGDVRQQLCDCVQAAAQGHNWNMASRLLKRLQAASVNGKTSAWSTACLLLQLQANASKRFAVNNPPESSTSPSREDVLELWQALQGLQADSPITSPSKKQQSAQQWPGHMACQGLLMLTSWLHGYRDDQILEQQMKAEGAESMLVRLTSAHVHVPNSTNQSSYRLPDLADGSQQLVPRLQYSALHEAVARCPSSATAWRTYADWLHAHAHTQSPPSDESAHNILSQVDRTSLHHAVAVNYAHSLALEADPACRQHDDLSLLLRILSSADASLKTSNPGQDAADSMGEEAEGVGLSALTQSSQGSTLSDVSIPAKPDVAASLPDALEGALAAIPLGKWCCSLPQLFSRLTTSHQGMRRLVKRILMRLLDAAPHILLYPLLGQLQSQGGKPCLCVAAMQ